MFYYLSILSYLIYSFLVTKLFATSLISSFNTGHFLVSLFKILILGFLIYEIIVEWLTYHRPKKEMLLKRQINKTDFYIFLSVLLSTLLSYLLNHTFALGAVVASSLIGIAGGLLLPSLAVSIYCGSFAGMVSSLLVDDPRSIIFVGFFAGLLYVFGSETFKGFGGKLGATAYFGTLLASIFFDTFNSTMTGNGITFQYEVFIVFIIGAIGTYLIKEQLKVNVVLASSLLGLLGGLLLPNMFSSGSSLAVALFCGTFIGMSTTSKLSTRVSVLVASLIGTIIYLYTAPYFAGLGGKLGLIAFGSSITTAGIYNFRSHISKKNKLP